MDLITVTEQGMIKRTALDEFRAQRRGGSGVRAANLAAGDRIAGAVAVQGSEEVIILTAQGTAIRFSASELRAMGRTASGVQGIRLGDGDRVVAVVAAR
jgi:DNA gyrase subunit A